MAREAGSAGNAIAITPSDTTKHQASKGVYVGVAGDLVTVMAGGNQVTRVGVVSGVVHPWSVISIMATGTTATDIILEY